LTFKISRSDKWSGFLIPLMAGIDQSKEMLKQCGRKYPQMDLKLGNFLAIPYLDGQFDFAVTSFALHHISDEQKLLALDEMRRVLKPQWNHMYY
jgi:putative AdoMet-dependent methyltransferase